MKNKLAIAALLIVLSGIANGQYVGSISQIPVLGVMGEYPCLYYYHFPHSGVVMEDSVYCSVSFGQMFGGIDSNYYQNYYSTNSYQSYFLHLHTPEVLHVYGIAVGYNWGGTFTLYDSNRVALASVSVENFLFPGIDTNLYHKILIPGNPYGQNSLANVLRFAPFDGFTKDSTMDIVGDFYIGFHSDEHGAGLYYMYEDHPAPYHFIGSEFHIAGTDGVWSPMYTDRAYPLLFPLIKPECVSVDSIGAVSDSAGCVSVDWEPQPAQTQWMVRLTGDDGSATEAVVDTGHLYQCGLQPGTTYTVSIKSQCRDYGGDIYYSPWSDSVAVTIAMPDTASIPDSTGTDPGNDTTDVGIPMLSTMHTLLIHPNPASGSVRLVCSEPMLSAEVFDMAGRTVVSAEPQATECHIGLGTLPSGIYMVRVTTVSGVVLQSLAVQ